MLQKNLPWKIAILATLTLGAVVAGVIGNAIYRLQRHHNAKAWMVEHGVNGGDSFGHAMDTSEWEFVRNWSPRKDHVVAVMSDEEVETDEVLRRCQGLIDVETVALYGRSLSNQQFRLLAKLSLLEVLHLDGSTLGDANFETLADLPVRHLSLRRTDVSDASLAQIAKLPHLESLDIGEANVSEAAIRAFAAQHPGMDITWSPHLTPHQKLLVAELSDNGVNIMHEYVLHQINSERVCDVSIGRINESPESFVGKLLELGPMRTITIGEDAISDELLAELPRLKHLQTIDIGGRNYTMAGLEPLLQITGLGRISCHGAPSDCTRESKATFQQRFQGIFDVRDPCL